MEQINNLKNTYNIASAMKAAGQPDELIVDRLIKSDSVDNRIKDVLKQAKSSGLQSKAIGDFLKVPVDTQILKKEDVKTKGFLGKAADFTGVEPLGRYLAAKASHLDPEYRKSIQTLRDSGQGASADVLSTGGVSGRELAGSIISTAAGIGLPFAGKALSGGTFGQRVLQSGLIQSGLGAASAAASGGSNENIKNSAIFGGIIGGGIPVIGALYRGLEGFISKYPENAYTKIFKHTIPDMTAKLNTLAAGKEVNPTLAKEILDSGITGSAEEMGTILGATRNSVGKELNTVAAKYKASNIPIPDRKHLVKVLTVIKNGFNEALVPEKVKEADSIIKYLTKVKPKNLNASQTLKLKQFIDSARSYSSFNNPVNRLSDKQGAFKKVADYFRGQIHLKIPELGAQLDAYRIAHEGFNSMVKEAVREGNEALLNRLDAIALGAGIVAGSPAVAGAAAGLIKLSRNPRFLTQSAQFVKKGMGGFTKPRNLGTIRENIQQAGRTGVRTLLSKF